MFAGGGAPRSCDGGTPGSFGGGIDATDAGTTVGLFSDTIAGNQASAGAGSLFVFGPDLNAFGSAAYTLQDTVIAAPVPSNQSACTSEGGVFTDLGHNLEDSTFSTCGLSGAANNDQLIADDQLASTLGANGGATMTLAPAATSPVIGNGGACTNPLASPTSSPLGVDQRGAPRGATCDIGAFQTEPISVTGAPVITGTAAIGETLTCASGTFSTGGDGAFTATGAIGAPTITNAFASNGTPVSSGNTYTVAPADQGHTITCSETATGAYGRGQATSAPVSVPATPVSVPAASASIPAAPVNVKLSIVSQAHSKWAEKKRKHGLPVGTSFTYTLNTPATVTLTITRQASGRQVKGQCVTQTRHNRHASRCTLTSKAGTLTGPGQVGANTVRFTGKIGSHRIAAGSYQLTITAKTPTGTSIAALSFTISR